MAASKKDPSAPLRLKASRYPGVEKGTACTQASFKVGKKSFLFVGLQGGRYKAMFKLKDSIPEASKLSQQDPDRFQVGSTAWVTARFSADKPLPKRLWEKWLNESYELSLGKGPGGQAAKAKRAKKKASKKKAAKKSRRR